jgi:hypothetical protein
MGEEDILAAWQYTNRMVESRREALAKPGSYERLIELTVENVRNISFRFKDQIDRKLPRCEQIIFLMEVPTIGDALFNGPYGIRAQYYLDSAWGLAANARLISRLSPKLLAAFDGDDPDFVITSLRAASAKIWIFEDDVLNEYDLPPELAIERWKSSGETAGLIAPYPHRFEVKGALLDSNRNEVVPYGKVDRHYQINDYGFA